MITGRLPTTVAPLLAAVALLLAGCTDDAADGTAGADGAAPTTSPAPSSAAGAGPLTAEVAPTPVGTTAVFRLGVSDSGQPALVLDDPGAVPPDDTRIGTGDDLAGSASPPVAGVSSGNRVGSPVVGDEGSVTALAALDTGDALGLHVLRVTADGAQVLTPVADAGIGRLNADTVDAVSDDGTTAVVATIDRLAGYPDDPDHLRVLTVDLATATVTGQAEVPLGEEGGLPTGTEPAAVRIGADGAVTVLVGAAGGQGFRTGAWLARFGPGLVPAGTVLLDEGAGFQRSRLDLTADGTAVVAMEVGTPAPLTTRLVTLAPGSDEVVPLAELESVTVDAVVTGPDGWAHLVATESATGSGTGSATTDAVRPLDLATGELAAPVPVCPEGTDGAASPTSPGSTFGLARSGSGDTLLALSSCGPDDVRVAVLRGR